MNVLDKQITCANESELVQALNDVKQQLDIDDRRKLNTALTQLLVSHGVRGRYLKLNGKLVREIIEHQYVSSEPISSGSIDGLRFRLFEPPDKT